MLLHTPHETLALEYVTRRKNLPHTPGIAHGCSEELFFSVFFVDRGLSSDGDSLDRLTYLIEGATVVTSSRMQVMKHRGAASQEGVR